MRPRDVLSGRLPASVFIYWRSERGGEPRYFRRAWPEGNADRARFSLSQRKEGLSAADSLFYYLENDQQSPIYEVAIGGERKPRVLDHIPPMKAKYWCVRGSQILYGDTRTDGPGTPVFSAPIAGGKPRLLFNLPVPPRENLRLERFPDLTEASGA